MILINLLPEEIRPIKRSPLPYIVTGACLVGAIAVMALMFVSSLATQASLRSEFASLESDLAKLKPIVDEHNQLQEKKVVLKEKIETIQIILSDRKIWSEHLHKLASLTPKNVWYSRIRVYSKPDKTTRQKLDPKTNKPEIDPKTKQPKTEIINIRVPVLEVSGYVINDDGGLANVNPLMQATTTDPDFSKHFELDNLSKMEDTEYKGFAVRSFTLQYKVVVDETVEAPQS